MKRKEISRTRRIVRGLCLFVVALLLYNVAGGCLPFARLPKTEDAAAIEARADAMQADVDTPDRAMLLQTHDDALDERIRLIERARREIVIATYDCRDGESTRDVLCVALERADAGVRVRVLVDGIAGVLNLSLNPMFRAFAAHPNVSIRFYNPPKLFMPWHQMGRMHDKYVIVDDLAYILGGRNMFDSFIGMYPVSVRKDDREVLVYNGARDAAEGAQSSLSEIREYFEGVWSVASESIGMSVTEARREREYADLRMRCADLRNEKPELFAALDYRDVTVPTKGVWLISNPTGFYAKQPTAYFTLCALMERAKESVFIQSPYAVLNGAMRERLGRIAEKVPVRLMVNAVETSHNVVASGDYLYHRSEVLSTGAELLEYAGENYHHGKAVAIDDIISIIGSFNLDIRSAYVDTEVMLVVRGAEFGALLRRSLEALVARCRRVNADGTGTVPEGVEIPPLPFIKKAALRVLGLLMQPLRNLV